MTNVLGFHTYYTMIPVLVDIVHLVQYISCSCIASLRDLSALERLELELPFSVAPAIAMHYSYAVT